MRQLPESILLVIYKGKGKGSLENPSLIESDMRISADKNEIVFLTRTPIKNPNNQFLKIATDSLYHVAVNINPFFTSRHKPAYELHHRAKSPSVHGICLDKNNGLYPLKEGVYWQCYEGREKGRWNIIILSVATYTYTTSFSTSSHQPPPADPKSSSYSYSLSTTSPADNDKEKNYILKARFVSVPIPDSKDFPLQRNLLWLCLIMEHALMMIMKHIRKKREREEVSSNETEFEKKLGRKSIYDSLEKEHIFYDEVGKYLQENSHPLWSDVARMFSISGVLNHLSSSLPAQQIHDIKCLLENLAENDFFEADLLLPKKSSRALRTFIKKNPTGSTSTVKYSRRCQFCGKEITVINKRGIFCKHPSLCRQHAARARDMLELIAKHSIRVYWPDEDEGLPYVEENDINQLPPRDRLIFRDNKGHKSRTYIRLQYYLKTQRQQGFPDERLKARLIEQSPYLMNNNL